MKEVSIRARSIARLEKLARAQDLERFERSGRALAGRLDGATLWHVNSTPAGGGVAELLSQLLGYVVEAGINCRWLVIDGDQGFFRLTKRIHNRLHGSPGDGGRLGSAESRVYRDVLEDEAAHLLDNARPGDVVVLHDPQTAGLTSPLVSKGLSVVWVCHVGVDMPNEVVRSAWDFLRPYVQSADAYVFTRRAYVWTGLDDRRSHVIPPCIDPTSAKNAEISAADVGDVLGVTGVMGSRPSAPNLRIGIDGLGRIAVTRKAAIVDETPIPHGAPMVLQVSRWDRLKDHLGVLRGFTQGIDRDSRAHLLLVGPEAESVTDDPEGAEVFSALVGAWQALRRHERERVHLVSLPVQDQIENAVMVNALQRAADVVIQKSLAEGFGLTVAEAMWKERPVVGSRVGGIQEQIQDARTGLLVDPSDLPALSEAVSSLIRDAGFAQAIGHAARERVRERYLPPHFLGAHLELLLELVARRGRASSV